MTRRAVMGIAVLIGLVAGAGLCADAVIGGTGRAADAAALVSAICEVFAVVTGVVTWAGGRRAVPAGPTVPDASSGTSDDAPPEAPPEPAAMTDSYRVDARFAHGVQIGCTSNSQNNTFGSATPRTRDR